MKYEKGDLIAWRVDELIAEFRTNKETFMVITGHEPKCIMRGSAGIYTYRYIDTGREDSYVDNLLEQNTIKIG